jgi:fatty-acyl-CoA synthase
VFYANSKVKQVAVFGVPDDIMGEVGAAYVELKMGEQCSERELKDFCKGRLANFKIPKYVVFTNDFPMTTSGKIQKFLLKGRAVKELGLHEKRR